MELKDKIGHGQPSSLVEDQEESSNIRFDASAQNLSTISNPEQAPEEKIEKVPEGRRAKPADPTSKKQGHGDAKGGDGGDRSDQPY